MHCGIHHKFVTYYANILGYNGNKQSSLSKAWTIFRLIVSVKRPMISHRDAVQLKQSTYLPKSNDRQNTSKLTEGMRHSIEMVMMMMGEKNTHMQASKSFLVRFPPPHLLQVLPIHPHHQWEWLHCYHRKNLHK